MPKYNVEYSVSKSYIVTIDADSQEEAEEEVTGRWFDDATSSQINNFPQRVVHHVEEVNEFVKVKILDDNDETWIFDENMGRIYLDGTLEEDPNSGYPADDMNEALEQLKEGGYICP